METKKIKFNDRWDITFLKHLSVMQVNQYKFWEKERMAHMYTAIRPDDVILDIGTCDGTMSAIFASWLGENGKMILVEPSPGFWPIIKAHFEMNNLKPYQCWQVLVSDKEEIPEDVNLDTLFSESWPECSNDEIQMEVGFSHVNEHPKIPIIKIDDMSLQKCDIITMDIEGSEYEALAGAEETLKRCKPILFISVHPEFMWREHHHSPDDLHVMLDKMGYDATYLAFDHEQHWVYKPRP